MADTQLMKGILEGCTLSVISRGETWGYMILYDLVNHGFADLREATLYTLLKRLKSKGYITCRESVSEKGHIRKYYTITDDGLNYLDEFYANYRKTANCAESVIEKSEKILAEKSGATK